MTSHLLFKNQLLLVHVALSMQATEMKIEMGHQVQNGAARHAASLAASCETSVGNNKITCLPHIQLGPCVSSKKQWKQMNW